jgi:hypothetical protein
MFEKFEVIAADDVLLTSVLQHGRISWNTRWGNIDEIEVEIVHEGSNADATAAISIEWIEGISDSDMEEQPDDSALQYRYERYRRWSNRQGEGINADESSRDMFTVLERRRDIPGLPFNIGTIGEGHPMAASNCVLRCINIRDPKHKCNIPKEDFKQNVILNRSTRCDRYQGRCSFLISPVRNSNGRRDNGAKVKAKADFSQNKLGTITRNVEQGADLLTAHYRAQERVNTAVANYMVSSRLLHFNYRTTSDHWGPWLDLEPPLSNHQWESNRMSAARGDERYSTLT